MDPGFQRIVADQQGARRVEDAGGVFSSASSTGSSAWAREAGQPPARRSTSAEKRC
jgi:hypothetical protein